LSAAWPWAARIRNPVLLLLKTASAPAKRDCLAGPKLKCSLAQYSCAAVTYAMRPVVSEGCSLWVAAQVGGDSVNYWDRRLILALPGRTCKAPIWHVKVRRPAIMNLR
jgi:hypothetical protein